MNIEITTTAIYDDIGIAITNHRLGLGKFSIYVGFTDFVKPWIEIMGNKDILPLNWVFA